MNRLLLLTDFSDASGDAQQYAVNLSRDYRLPLMVLQQVVVPVPFVGPDEMLLPVVPIADTREVAQQRLDEKLDTLRGANPDLSINGKLFYGDVSGLADEDENYANATLIIPNDVSGADAGWLDTEAPGLLRNAPTSVIAIPPNGTYKPISRIVLALDPSADVAALPLRPLQAWLQVTGAELHVIMVGDDAGKTTHMADAFPLEASFQTLPPAAHLEEAILSAVTGLGADWVAVTPHSHGVISGLFHKGHIQALAKTCPVPLIALHMQEG